MGAVLVYQVPTSSSHWLRGEAIVAIVAIVCCLCFVYFPALCLHDRLPSLGIHEQVERLDLGGKYGHC